MACLTNLRMLCGSTYLIDRQTNVSPKLDELAERLSELLGHEPAAKVVVFSQWEMMLGRAAEAVERLGLGYAMLHGNIPGPERRKLLDRFRDDPACRVFLSTDAGGTGLNLQSAHTVINLEVPWNPAVLEQRVARVHRMGQHRAVQVIHLVMRGTIEERVLEVVAQKKALFEELFAGTGDEIAIGAMGQQAFLEAIREVLGQGSSPALEPAPAVSIGAGPVVSEPSPALAQAGVAFLEALAQALTQPGAYMTNDPQTGRPALVVPLPQAQLHRGAEALAAIARALAERGSA